MKRNSRKLIVLSILFIFIVSAINLKSFYNIAASSNEIEVEKSIENEPINKELINIEQPKTASPSGQSYNFTFNTSICETWNRTWIYPWSGSSEGGDSSFSFLIQYDTTGFSVFYEFNITDLINMSDIGYPKLNPSAINLALEQYNGSHAGWVEVGKINDGVAIGDGYLNGYITMNWSVPGVFRVTYDYYGKTNITYYPTMKFWRNPFQSEVKTEFIPDSENTKSDTITWELNYNNYLPGYVLGYRANLTIQNFTDFTLREVKGRKGSYWEPIDYKIINNYLILNESAEEYVVELQTPNYISVMYNDNLTYKTDSNELNLHVTCNMNGKLTIQFKDSNGTIYEEVKDQEVSKGETVDYNYVMLRNATGGIGFLNITLVNNSKIFFGVRFDEIIFHKQTIIVGFTDDTFAFEPNFFIACFYLDFDYFFDLLVYKGYDIDTQFIDVINLTIIRDAKVTHNLEGYIGELDYEPVPGTGGSYAVYLKQLDLRELQLPAGEYNLTFTASKPGYDTNVNVTKFEIKKRPATIEIKPTKNNYAIEENFTIIIDLSVNYPGFGTEDYLRVPSILNITFINNDTGKIEVGPIPWWKLAVQSLDISDTIENDTIPGNYRLNVTLVSDYYEGSVEHYIKITKKLLTISLVYDEDDLIEDEEFEVLWELSGGGSKNRENMSVEVLIDGYPHAIYDLETSYGGITKFELDEGEYYITYRLISPFYTAEMTVKLEIEKEEEPEPTWLEENWYWLVIGIIAVIAMAALAIFLLISRHKMKAQRELESELIALKTKISTTEQNISLIETQISQIASIYWILIIHSEQGVTMIEIVDFKFEEIFGTEQKELIGKGTIRDSALIGGFLTAIRNFSRETSGTSLEYQPVFNSQTDYSTVVDDEEIHRRILEGTQYFMAFVSSRGTIEISDVLSSVNSLFQDGYGEAVREFDGAISPFKSFEKEAVTYLHNQIRDLQKKLIEERLLLERFESHLKEVQEQIGIKPKKLK